MHNPMVDGINGWSGLNRFFADLGEPDADKLKFKSGLAAEVVLALKRLGLTQKEASQRMGIPQSKVSGLLVGNFSGISERRLMTCLTRLGYNVEVKVTWTSQAIGRVGLVIT